MKYLFYTLQLLLVLQLSCCKAPGYSLEKDVDFGHLNDSIRKGVASAAPWAIDPPSISKHLFPSHTLPEGNRTYSVAIEDAETSSTEVIITDEGTAGERWKATFQLSGDLWQLTSLTKSIK